MAEQNTNLTLGELMDIATLLDYGKFDLNTQIIQAGRLAEKIRQIIAVENAKQQELTSEKEEVKEA